jgi:hypothetical protein
MKRFHRNKLTDYKDRIQNKAEELAREKYDKDFYDLPEKIRDKIYNLAMELYKDHYAAEIDAAYDRRMEERLIKGKEK